MDSPQTMQAKESPESPLHKAAVPSNTSATSQEFLVPKKKGTKCCKCFKITCCILCVIIVALIGVLLFFALYIFKKRAVEVKTTNVTLENLSYTILPTITLDIVMGINIGIKNPNYAGFKFEAANTTFFYHGLPTGSSPMPAGVVKARSSKKIHSTVYINATTMINTPYLLGELIGGAIPLSSRTYLVGKAIIFNFIKLRASVLTTCDITLHLQSTTTSAKCKGDVKIL